MKKILIIIIFSFYVNSTVAQDFIYFNKIISSDTTNLLSIGVLPIDKGYLVVGGFKSYNNYDAIYVCRLDEYGEIEWTKILDDESHEQIMVTGTSFIKTSDGNFIAGYSKQKPGTTDQDMSIVKFTEEGEVLWKKMYGGEGHEGVRHILQTADEGFLITGFQRKPDQYQTFYCVKTDPEGELESEHTYTFSNQGDSFAFSAEKTGDGNYIIAGRGYRNDTKHDMFWVVTDSSFKEVKRFHYGTKESDGGGGGL